MWVMLGFFIGFSHQAAGSAIYIPGCPMPIQSGPHCRFSVILAGVVYLKTGAYGSDTLCRTTVPGSIYGHVRANCDDTGRGQHSVCVPRWHFAQDDDLKRLIAYTARQPHGVCICSVSTPGMQQALTRVRS